MVNSKDKAQLKCLSCGGKLIKIGEGLYKCALCGKKRTIVVPEADKNRKTNSGKASDAGADKNDKSGKSDKASMAVSGSADNKMKSSTNNPKSGKRESDKSGPGKNFSDKPAQKKASASDNLATGSGASNSQSGPKDKNSNAEKNAGRSDRAKKNAVGKKSPPGKVKGKKPAYAHKKKDYFGSVGDGVAAEQKTDVSVQFDDVSSAAITNPSKSNKFGSVNGGGFKSPVSENESRGKENIRQYYDMEPLDDIDIVIPPFPYVKNIELTEVPPVPEQNVKTGGNNPISDSKSRVYADDVRDGDGEFKCPDGTTYKGGLKDGLRDGFGETMYPNGDTYKGEYVDDVASGKGIMGKRDGSLYAGMFAGDKWSGKGVYRDIHKYMHVGYFGYMSFEGKTYLPDEDDINGDDIYNEVESWFE